MIETVVNVELQALADGTIREIWYPGDFAKTIKELENAGPMYRERIANLRQQMEPFRDRIVNIYDF